MIVPNQSNLKVHYAGAEDIRIAEFIHSKADINYHLFTVYPFIRKKQKNDKEYIQRLEKISKHSIMDSGLFTLMFGAEKGKKDAKFLDNWTEKLIEFIQETNYAGTYVDVDCQKILGVDQAWKYRKLLRSRLPNNRQINVFHIEDGKKGLDELIEYTDYIAISVPELRSIKKSEYLYRVFCYIKNKKPDIDVHLLGYTEFKGISKYKDASSCDSVSWKQGSMYGQIVKLNTQKNSVEVFVSNTKRSSNSGKRIDYDAIGNSYESIVREHFNKKLTERSIINYGIDLSNAKEYRKISEYFVGPQD